MLNVEVALFEPELTFYEVPAPSEIKGYRYTFVNDTPVLGELKTRKIAQVIREAAALSIGAGGRGGCPFRV